MKKFVLYICVFSLGFSPLAQANEQTEFKSIFWTPLVSIALPGLGQAIDGQSGKSVIFGGLALAGYSIYAAGDKAQKAYLAGPEPDDNRYFDNDLIMKIGSSMALHAGFMSAFDTFQNRIGVYQEVGKYQFLPKEQKIEDLLMAPFHFSYLQRPTTWIPFLMSMALSVDYYNTNKPAHFHARGIDPAVATYVSYNAGTGEEAYFRGVLYPNLYEAWNGHWTANVAQSLIFGYMHGPQPYPQIIAGYYLGFLAEKNGFELGENIFIHAWWDVWLLAANYIKNRGRANSYYVEFPQFIYRF